jgi:uncharacterized protein YqfA (UPF0365 family)
LLLAAVLNYLFSFLQWYLAVNAGINISLMKLFKMRRQGIPAHQILENLVKAKHFGLDINWEQLQKHNQAGGNLYNVVDGMVRGKQFGLKIPFQRAVNADLQKIDIQKAVNIIAEYRGLEKRKLKFQDPLNQMN